MIRQIRAWAERHTAERRYSPVGIVFHWVMAALIAFQLYWGWYMGRLPAGVGKAEAFQVHSDVGLFMLLLATLRFVWRLIVPGPINDADRLGWQTRAAEATHVVFYACFFGLPLSGWAMWSAVEGAPDLAMLGLLPWPMLPFQEIERPLQWLILDWAEGVHLFLVVVLLVMIPLHVSAALKHHFVDRHDVLEGMLPELPEDRARDSRQKRRAGGSRPASGAG